jgi:hypothetical protein
MAPGRAAHTSPSMSVSMSMNEHEHEQARGEWGVGNMDDTDCLYSVRSRECYLYGTLLPCVQSLLLKSRWVLSVEARCEDAVI